GDSPLLSRPEQAEYTYHFEDDKLIFINEKSNLKMEYAILSHDSNEWQLSYLDEIYIRFVRK
ncbi:MAG: hypothetical protein P8X57_06415, partial [Cyclobacteriaceae bacterium]